MPQKADLKRELSHLYNPPATKFTVLEVPSMNFLMVDGHGDPNTTPAFEEAVQTLYGVSYTIKSMSKKELDRDYTVMPLEGLWWTADMRAFSVEAKHDWDWTLMIMQPEWIAPELVAAARVEAGRKKVLPVLDRLRFEAFHEGLCVQIMHIGPYATEAPTLERMHNEFIPSMGCVMAGKHHEIYLSDPRRGDPPRRKTVLRRPIRPAPEPRATPL